MCDRNRKCLEISVCCGTERRRLVCAADPDSDHFGAGTYVDLYHSMTDLNSGKLNSIITEVTNN